MAWLVLGATGALGEAAVSALSARGVRVITQARSGADETFDLADLAALESALDRLDPDAVFNSAGQVDLAACERDPGAAYAVNARCVATLARWSAERDRPLVHISTDLFFLGADPSARWSETARPTLINEYARSKYAGDAFAQTAPRALVARTNMTAARGGRGKRPLAAWALDQIEARAPLTLFADYYASTIDAPALAEACLDLVERGAAGVFNVASRDVFSKARFIRALADAAGVELDWATEGSARALAPPRPLNAGLDVTKVEAALGRAMPGLAGVAQALVNQRRADR